MKNPFKKRSADKVGVWFAGDLGESLCIPGYTPLSQNPEVVTACRRIAELIGSMTIHLMNATDDGDFRIKNELSRAIDIEPVANMTRSTWMQAIVMNLLLYGNGNSIVIPHTSRGYLRDLEPVAASRVTFENMGFVDYRVNIDGKSYRPDSVLHFVYNPDKTYLWKGTGVRVILKDIVGNLKQAEVTKKGFMESKWKPSVIVKVDAMTETFSTPSGRKKILEDYIQTEKAGEPWIIPNEQVQVETIKPLTLADLAISDSVEVDKRTVAAVMGVPPFLLGVGEYNKEAWNSFIQNTIRPLALSIAQEMTRKLILSPNWYLKFNVRSLMDWDLQTLSSVFGELRKQGVVDGNEVRDAVGLSPREGLDELVMLENYIPSEKLGDQKKLIQEGE